MRIRKHASKILGLAAPLIPPYPSPPPSPFSSGQLLEDSCQHNRSPWDVLDDGVIIPNPKGKEVENGPITTDVIIITSDEEDKIGEASTSKKRKERQEDESAGSSFKCCEFTDGKGLWLGMRRGSADVKVKLGDEEILMKSKESAVKLMEIRDGVDIAVAGKDEDALDESGDKKREKRAMMKARSISSL